ncbi:MAG: hypothetical protein Q9212_003622 [Teloschistes hypoglaucus]
MRLVLSSITRLRHNPIKPSQWTTALALGRRPSSSLSDLETEMTSRELSPLLDTNDPHQAFSLSNALSDFLPKGSNLLDQDAESHSMPRGYHLVYFPPETAQDPLLPDGTDPLHSPGEPFTRRMWAGGDITFRAHGCRLFPGEIRCQESITDVNIKGNEGAEKVFVNIRRELAYPLEDQSYTPKGKFLIENRRLVFMRAHQSNQASAAQRAILKPPHKPTFSHKLIPTAELLSTFSDLTSNGHRIHLDKQYCQEVEGHRNLLVHGPLSLVLMLQTLQFHHKAQAERDGKKPYTLKHVEYKNLAPLYAEEEMKVCLRQKNPHDYEIWIEGPDGGLAVKGTATMMLRKETEPEQQLPRGYYYPAPHPGPENSTIFTTAE